MKDLIKSNNDLIEALVFDPNYMILSCGEVLTRIKKNGRVGSDWRLMGHKTKKNPRYWVLKYKGKNLFIHRVVYRKFFGYLGDRLEINHKDGDGLNNHIENLELVSHSKNVAHSFRVLNRPAVIGNFKINKKIADKIRFDHERGLPYSALCAKYKLSKGTISLIVNGKIWKAS
jgi:HNH endonuclease